MLVVKGPKQDYWLINSAADVYICNDLMLITDFIEKPTRVERSMVDVMSLGCVII